MEIKPTTIRFEPVTLCAPGHNWPNTFMYYNIFYMWFLFLALSCIPFSRVGKSERNVKVKNIYLLLFKTYLINHSLYTLLKIKFGDIQWYRTYIIIIFTKNPNMSHVDNFEV